VAHLRSLTPVLFLGAHGSFIGLAGKIAALGAGNARAFVDPEGYRQYVDRALEQIEKTLAEQGEPGGCAAVLR
jgi:metallo-beta-lactamase class B